MSNFVAVETREQEEAYRDVVLRKRPLQIQIAGEKLKQGKVFERKENEIIFQLPYMQRFEGEFEAILTFSLGTDIYFLKTTVVGKFGVYSFRETKNIFRLQRRDTFRLKIPTSVVTRVKFESAGSFPIYDLSQGGFSIELPATKSDSFVTGTKMIVDIQILDETITEVNCESKHARVQPLTREKVLVGFEFLKLANSQEELLFRLISDIARTHFR